LSASKGEEDILEVLDGERGEPTSEKKERMGLGKGGALKKRIRRHPQRPQKRKKRPKAKEKEKDDP